MLIVFGKNFKMHSPNIFFCFAVGGTLASGSHFSERLAHYDLIAYCNQCGGQVHITGRVVGFRVKNRYHIAVCLGGIHFSNCAAAAGYHIAASPGFKICAHVRAFDFFHSCFGLRVGFHDNFAVFVKLWNPILVQYRAFFFNLDLIFMPYDPIRVKGFDNTVGIDKGIVQLIAPAQHSERRDQCCHGDTKKNKKTHEEHKNSTDNLTTLLAAGGFQDKQGRVAH